jgi:glycolate oxidase FAD binding subunit
VSGLSGPAALALSGGFAAICGPEQVRPAGEADSVAGVHPGLVVAPGTIHQAADVLRLAAEHDLAAVARGAGTKLDWGAAPSRVDVLVDTRRLAGVHYHAPGDLVATVGAGTPLGTVQQEVARSGQRVALDGATPDATVGGVLATNEAGPLRLTYGLPRDLLIGVQFVRADGVVAHSGGRVVKNVAGYDLGKLLCGSYGVLGLITTATFRLHPLPAGRVWVTRAVGSPLEVHELTAALLASPLAPTAVEVDLPADPAAPSPRQRGESAGAARGALSVLLEGSQAGVAARAQAVVKLLGGDADADGDPPQWWGRYPFGRGDLALKLAAPVADLHAAVYALRDSAGAAAPVRGSAAAGVVYSALPGSMPAPKLALVLDAVRTTLLGRGGFCTVLYAPELLRESVDLWGAVPGLPLMRRIKEQFDPRRSLAPGRLAGGG